VVKKDGRWVRTYVEGLPSASRIGRGASSQSSCRSECSWDTKTLFENECSDPFVGTRDRRPAYNPGLDISNGDSLRVNVQTFHLSPLSVRTQSPSLQFQSLNSSVTPAQLPQSGQPIVPPLFFFCRLPTIFHFRNATAVFRIAADALGRTDPRHAPMT